VTWNHFFFFWGKKKGISSWYILYQYIKSIFIFYFYIKKKKKKKKDQSLEFKTNQVVIKV
jgi:hypothetical protein